ncbi:MAG: circularly permuted type 2 ATP-grasp protein [Hyphomicrobiaceae bacterium]|nr:circularly permuted type 2 ATP-grasp protein [Hyphomicrobiaceae bacterium]
MSYLAPREKDKLGELLDGYRPPLPGTYDELVGHDGSLRPHWLPFLTSLSDLPRDEIANRARRLDKRVHQIGIAYDIFADPNTPHQRWTVDLLPLILGPGEWRWLERALTQRARLFDAILADVYGTQTLLRDGLIPPALVFSDPAYLRPLQGVQPPGGHLQFYAADLARDASGQWRVIDNHTETPAGVGSALANRVAHTHVAGDLFKATNGRRIAAFFQDLQASITETSRRSNPRVALLTTGPHHEDYFSHAYLARYLGYLLVEGNDLRSVGDRIYLKTLEGLKEIDVLVRCIEGHAADPLELDPAGFAGPVGLVQVVRQSPGLVVNAIGSAVVQNRGLGACLPAIARRVLGEDLLLPDTPRRWLGHGAGVADDPGDGLGDLDAMVIRKAQEGVGRPGRAALGQRLADLRESERGMALKEIELTREHLVAEPRATFGTTPSLAVGPGMAVGLQPVAFALRLFVTRTVEGFALMPGGLAMSIDPDKALGLSSPEGGTRDVWVIADHDMPAHTSLWRPTLEAAHVERSQRVTQSRAADDLYWLGRYSERADWTMRVLRSALQRQQEDGLPVEGQGAARRCLEVLLTDKPLQVPRRRDLDDQPAIEALARDLISGSTGNRVLARTLDGLYRCASLTRDRLSLEAWQTLDRFQPMSDWRRELVESRSGVAIDRLEEGLASLASFAGLMHENMTRNFGWFFLDMGRRLSRAYNLSEAVFALFAAPLAPEEDEEVASLRFLLEAADSFITYRSRYRLDPMLPLVLDLLLLDESNPRSLAFQLAAISRHLESLPRADNGSSLPEERRRILALQTAVRLADVQEFGRGDRSGLAEIMTRMVEDLPSLSNSIARRYFSLLQERPHRLTTRSGPKP